MLQHNLAKDQLFDEGDKYKTLCIFVVVFFKKPKKPVGILPTYGDLHPELLLQLTRIPSMSSSAYLHQF